MTGGWAATNTLRASGFCEVMDDDPDVEGQCWERDGFLPEDWCYPCGSRMNALALVEAALDAAERFVAADKANDETIAALLADPGDDPNATENLRDAQKQTARLMDEAFPALAAALRAVREGK